MKIGIIGTGNMGSGLGKQWAANGHPVLFGSRDPQKARTVADSVGANASLFYCGDDPLPKQPSPGRRKRSRHCDSFRRFL